MVCKPLLMMGKKKKREREKKVVGGIFLCWMGDAALG
jgi:hypothetical protein